MYKKNAPGFSLMEVLVYLVIVGALLSFLVPRIRDAFQMTKRFKTTNFMSTLEQGLNRFNLDVNRFPTTREGLDALLDEPADVHNWQGPYLGSLKEIPRDGWNHEFEYNSPPVEYKTKYREYELISSGPDETDPRGAIHIGQ
jgi:general secretion pathway protein G